SQRRCPCSARIRYGWKTAELILMNDIISPSGCPDIIPKAAEWFHDKWGIAAEVYADSMRMSLDTDCGVPMWYIITDGGNIIAGLGVIENDFHKRPDLTPNICAVYVDEAYRGRGLMRALLKRAVRDLARHGAKYTYLITDYVGLYEKCGWEFYGMVEENDGRSTRMYYIKTEE
ncbi:MAG: GNAT family N-acetyltransferase, partial [Oscillospiraceae bacterium]